MVQYRAHKQSRRLTLDAGARPWTRPGRKPGSAWGRSPRGTTHWPKYAQQAATVEAAKTNTLKMVATDYFKREGKKIRTMKEREFTFERLIFPRLGDRQIDQIQRSDIVKLLDHIEDNNGPVRADKTLAFLRKLFAWHATRNDTFRSPIVRGMARTKPHERARARVLSDAEIAAVLRAVDAQPGAFSSLVHFLLLTAARRNEAAHMTWGEVNGTGYGRFLRPAAKSKRTWFSR